MTLYEVGDLINSTSSNIIAAQAIFFTTITAYLVVAYSVGKSLTTYLVAFINVAFLIGMATGVMGVVANDSLIAENNSIRQVLVGQRVPEVLDTAWVITFTAVRAVLIFGALVFMWQVRHPRTE